MNPLFLSQFQRLSGLPSTSQACMMELNLSLQVLQLGFLSGWYFSTRRRYCVLSSPSVALLAISSTAQWLISGSMRNCASLTQMTLWYCSAPSRSSPARRQQKMVRVSPFLFLLFSSICPSLVSSFSYSSLRWRSSYFSRSSCCLRSDYFSFRSFYFSSRSCFYLALRSWSCCCCSGVRMILGGSRLGGYFWLRRRCSWLKSKLKMAFYCWQRAEASGCYCYYYSCSMSWAHLDLPSARSISQSSRSFFRFCLRGGIQQSTIFQWGYE